MSNVTRQSNTKARVSIGIAPTLCEMLVLIRDGVCNVPERRTDPETMRQLTRRGYVRSRAPGIYTLTLLGSHAAELAKAAYAELNGSESEMNKKGCRP